ncbi:MAG: oadA [Firmicutes bacterium]|nr:oadA [Bacillota bacterium]
MKHELKSANPVRISSVEFRDGQQSLLATRLKTADMLPILPKMDLAGFCSMEMWGGATFDSCIRFLQEDPWERVRAFKKEMKNTPLRMLLRGQNVVGYNQYPDDIVELFVQKAAEAGIDIFLVFDGLHDLRNCETAIRAALKTGKAVEGNLLYTVSPVHDIDLYVRVAREFEQMGVQAIHFEDMAGQLKPEVAYEAIRAIKAAINIPLHVHCHCTGGMADMAYWEAIRAGVDVIDTDISALSLGTAHPPTESFVVALQDTARDTGMKLDLLAEINAYFLKLRGQYKEFESKFTGVDISVLRHQVPGGMLSNLESQLKQMNALDRIDEVLEEVHHVRRDFGYPPLGTPFSQIVGAQATMNVLLGERYKIVSREAKDYIKGLYGKPPGDIAPELANKVLGDESRITCRPADLLEPGYEKLKTEIGALARTDEDVLTYAMFPGVAPDFLRNKYGLSKE